MSSDTCGFRQWTLSACIPACTYIILYTPDALQTLYIYIYTRRIYIMGIYIHICSMRLSGRFYNMQAIIILYTPTQTIDSHRLRGRHTERFVSYIIMVWCLTRRTLNNVYNIYDIVHYVYNLPIILYYCTCTRTEWRGSTMICWVKRSWILDTTAAVSPFV